MALAVPANLVADAANRSNQGAVVSGIYLAAQIVYVDVHDIRHGVKIEFPDLGNNGGAGNGLALVAHQEFKQREFLWAEVDVMTSTAHRVTDAVDFEVFYLENRARRPAPSAQYRANARGKFRKGEGFCDVIVGAGVEPADALLNHAGAGHDDHRQIRLPGANSAQDLQPARGLLDESARNRMTPEVLQANIQLFSDKRDC